MSSKRKSLPPGYEINPATGRKRKSCPSGKIRSEKGSWCVNDKSLRKSSRKRRSRSSRKRRSRKIKSKVKSRFVEFKEIKKKIKETENKIKDAEKDIKVTKKAIRDEEKKDRNQYEDDEEQQDNIDALNRTLQDEEYIALQLRIKLEYLSREEDDIQDELDNE